MTIITGHLFIFLSSLHLSWFLSVSGFRVSPPLCSSPVQSVPEQCGWGLRAAALLHDHVLDVLLDDLLLFVVVEHGHGS